MFLGYLLSFLFAASVTSALERKIINVFDKKEDVKKTDTAEYNFIVNITITSGKELTSCYGTYVDALWVLTAAHCVRHRPKGTVITCCMEETTDQCEHPRLVIRKTDMETIDIALLKLARPFHLGPKVQLAQMPKDIMELEDLQKQDCIIVGWGSEKSSYRKSSTKAVLLSMCDLTEKICVLSVETGPCRGESGAPLVCNKVVVGVLSTSTVGKCGKEEVRYLYSRVDREGDFISSTIKKSYELVTNGALNRQFSTNLGYLTVYWIIFLK